MNMDLWNNAQGRKIARDFIETHLDKVFNVSYNYQHGVAEVIKDYMESGLLIVDPEVDTRVYARDYKHDAMEIPAGSLLETEDIPCLVAQLFEESIQASGYNR